MLFRSSDAFPNREGPESLLPLINLEIWGAPTSEPARDPRNSNFVYQRFQRRIAHYDDTCKCTQGILLGDILKSVITGENIPPDLDEQAKGSGLYRQYDPGSKGGVKRPNAREMEGTDMTRAFETDRVTTAGSATTASTSSSTSAPSSNSSSASSTRPSESSSNNSSSSSTNSRTSRTELYQAQSPEYGMNVFLWGHEDTTDRKSTRLNSSH